MYLKCIKTSEIFKISEVYYNGGLIYISSRTHPPKEQFMKLETITRTPVNQTHKTPLLFIHGMW
ncbi:MAG TPA: hypothetical protein PKV19_09260, partial [Anaerolineales bacterium]|nr:hypothetical protein [Anaerolineales bacterium]